MKTILEINKKYGKWKILSFDKVDEKRRRRYNCECECGIVKSISAACIARGDSKSCNRCRAADLTGKKFGNWTVISKHNESSKNKHTLWLCECTCGKRNLVERCNLIRNKSRGCWKCQRNVITTQYFPPSWYRKQISQAKTRNLEWNITEKELWNILNEQNFKCAISGIDLFVDKDCKKITASIDRINSDFFYEKNNVWFVHKHINLMKFNFDINYFLKMCILISENNKI
jgi:hypothetical protein